MARYRKKPIEVEAFQLTDRGAMSKAQNPVPTWLAKALLSGDVVRGDDKMMIRTLEGTMWAAEGDWIIRGVKGELYPCKPDIFDATYELVSEAPSP